MRAPASVIWSAAALLAAGCTGTTGDSLVTFAAAAAGATDATNGLSFRTGRGFDVTLTKAILHVGALYLNQSMPVSGAQETNCVLPGTYVGEVTRGRDIDLLSSELQALPGQGEGTTVAARVGEVWLTGGPINALDDRTQILVVEGTVQRDKGPVAFQGTITIGKNRIVAVADPSQPGMNPICKQRIVSPIPVALAPRAAGTLLVRIDVKELFLSVDFAALGMLTSDPPIFGFSDGPRDQPSISLYQALRSTAPYRFEWIE